MANYKVKALSVGIKGKVFRNGEEVDEKFIPDGHAEKLVKNGFLEEIKATKKQANRKPAAEK